MTLKGLGFKVLDGVAMLQWNYKREFERVFEV